jgi:hypothetical protein
MSKLAAGEDARTPAAIARRCMLTTDYLLLTTDSPSKRVLYRIFLRTRESNGSLAV